jgi:hypothetical protein
MAEVATRESSLPPPTARQPPTRIALRTNNTCQTGTVATRYFTLAS